MTGIEIEVRGILAEIDIEVGGQLGAGVAIDFYRKLVGIETECLDFRLMHHLLFVIEIDLALEHQLNELRLLLGSRQELRPNLIGIEIRVWCKAGIETEPDRN